MVFEIKMQIQGTEHKLNWTRRKSTNVTIPKQITVSWGKYSDHSGDSSLAFCVIPWLSAFSKLHELAEGERGCLLWVHVYVSTFTCYVRLLYLT